MTAFRFSRTSRGLGPSIESTWYKYYLDRRVIFCQRLKDLFIFSLLSSFSAIPGLWKLLICFNPSFLWAPPCACPLRCAGTLWSPGSATLCCDFASLQQKLESGQKTFPGLIISIIEFDLLMMPLEVFLNINHVMRKQPKYQAHLTL